MRDSFQLFLYEYTTVVPTPDPGTSSLNVEGWAMLSAVLEDFSRIPGVRTATLVHAGLKRQLGHQCTSIQPEAEEDEFKELARAADFTLVIAPEIDGLLERRCRWVHEAGGRLLGPSPAAVALTADKLALAEHFHRLSIPTPATVLLSSVMERTSPAQTGSYPAVCKPRYGAGSLYNFRVESAAALATVGRTARCAELILQPFVPGQSASVAFLVGPVGIEPLLPASQELSNDGRLRYLGGRIPLPTDLAGRAIHLGRRAVEAVAGLRGYVGVDLVLGPDPNGARDTVIEINPRLTTSYIGLRRLACSNLAQAMLDSTAGARVPSIEWQAKTLVFHCDGRVSM